MRAWAFDKLHILQHRLQISGVAVTPEEHDHRMIKRVVKLTDREVNELLRKHERDVMAVLDHNTDTQRWEYSFQHNGSSIHIFTTNTPAVQRELEITGDR